jgi:hypothetical protein
MGAMEKANPKTYKNDSEYQKLSQEFDAQSRTVRENKLAGGSAGHDRDSSPYQKLSSETGNQKVDREISHNPDAYVGSGKGEVDKVLHPDQYGTPEKGTGVFNEQTAIHKQGTPLERHQQQYAEAQKLREQLKTDTNLSAAEKTVMGKKIADLEYQSASNHYESVRTTAKEFNVINKINDVNIKNGLGDGLSSDAKQIGNWANQVAKGEMDAGTYKKLVTEKYGSEENALKIVAKGFRDTNL